MRPARSVSLYGDSRTGCVTYPLAFRTRSRGPALRAPAMECPCRLARGRPLRLWPFGRSGPPQRPPPCAGRCGGPLLRATKGLPLPVGRAEAERSSSGTGEGPGLPVCVPASCDLPAAPSVSAAQAGARAGVRQHAAYSAEAAASAAKAGQAGGAGREGVGGPYLAEARLEVREDPGAALGVRDARGGRRDGHGGLPSSPLGPPPCSGTSAGRSATDLTHTLPPPRRVIAWTPICPPIESVSPGRPNGTVETPGNRRGAAFP
jgi:hypothetical protein